MNKKVDIQEFAVVVVARNHNPTILNPDFLKYNEIVPADWELAEVPICTGVFAQVRYKNGITIVTQVDKVIFTEMMGARGIKDAQIPKIAIKYIETLPHVDYHAIGINPKGHVVADTEEQARYYILNHLIASGPWKLFEGNQPKVTTQFVYPIEQGSLNLTLEDSFLSPPGQKPVPILILTSNFHRDIVAESNKEKVAKVTKIIQSWKEDVETFRSLVEKTFLSDEVKL